MGDHLNNESSGTCRVSEWYDGQVVLLTGGTGFLGKLALEKLLRATNVATIYLIVRPKPGKSPDQRLQDIFNNEIFCGVKDAWSGRVEVIGGDVSTRGLGLSAEDRRRITARVTLVIHAASALSFTSSLKSATATNVGGTKRILQLARQMPHLKACILVSTAFCYHPQEEVGEVIYPSEVGYTDLLKVAKTIDESDKILTEKIVGDSQTTYILTKKVAEQVVLDFADLPVSIFRPSIVLSTAEEPIAGWLENKYGPTGIVISIMKGYTHTCGVRLDAVADLVPADKTVNCLLSAACDTASRYSYQQSKEIPVYNYVSINEAPITWLDYIQACLKYNRQETMKNRFWYTFVLTTQFSLLIKINMLLFHYMPGLILDAFLVLIGRKPRILYIHYQIHKISEIFMHFSRRTYKYRNKNVEQLLENMAPEDKLKFPFTMKGFDWEKYIYDYFIGINKYLLKEHQQKDGKKFIWANNLITIILLGLVGWLFCTLTTTSHIIITQLIILFLFSYKYLSLRMLV